MCRSYEAETASSQPQSENIKPSLIISTQKRMRSLGKRQMSNSMVNHNRLLAGSKTEEVQTLDQLPRVEAQAGQAL